MNIEYLLEERSELHKKIHPLSERVKEIDSEFIVLAEREISNYLSKNKISGDSYIFCRTEDSGSSRIIHMRRKSDYPIDEDFESDENFESFTKSIASRFGFYHIDVPHYYYPK